MPSSKSSSSATKTKAKDMLSYRATSGDNLDLSRGAGEDNKTYLDRVTKMAEEAAYNLAVDAGSNYVKAMELYPQEVTGRWFTSEKDYRSIEKAGTNGSLTNILPSLRTQELSDFTKATTKAALNMTATGQTAKSLGKLLLHMEKEDIPYENRNVTLSVTPTYNGGENKGNVILRSSWSTEKMKKPIEFGSSRISLDTLDLVKSNPKASKKMESHVWNSSAPTWTNEQSSSATKRFSDRMKSIDEQYGRKPAVTTEMQSTATKGSTATASARSNATSGWLSRLSGGFFGKTSSSLITSTA